MAEELGEKTEEPTAHRMNKARDEGQVAWSKDFASFVVLFSGTVALMLLHQTTAVEEIIQETTAAEEITLATIPAVAIIPTTLVETILI